MSVEDFNNAVRDSTKNECAVTDSDFRDINWNVYYSVKENVFWDIGSKPRSLSESSCLLHESRTTTFVEEDLRSSSCSGS